MGQTKKYFTMMKRAREAKRLRRAALPRYINIVADGNAEVAESGTWDELSRPHSLLMPGRNSPARPSCQSLSVQKGVIPSRASRYCAAFPTKSSRATSSHH